MKLQGCTNICFHLSMILPSNDKISIYKCVKLSTCKIKEQFEKARGATSGWGEGSTEHLSSLGCAQVFCLWSACDVEQLALHLVGLGLPSQHGGLFLPVDVASLQWTHPLQGITLVRCISLVGGRMAALGNGNGNFWYWSSHSSVTAGRDSSVVWGTVR